MTLPPLEVFLSDDWIGGAAVGQLAAGLQPTVSPSIGDVLRFAEQLSDQLGDAAAAITTVMDIGAQVVTAVQGGTPTGLAGLSASAIQLLAGRLRYAVDTGAAKAKANALRAQWDIATRLVLRRVEVAKNLPGGANFSMVQPGWKKDFPAAAVPPIPSPVKTYYCPGGKHPSNTGPCKGYPKGFVFKSYTRLVLFRDAEATPDGVDYNEGCFSLGEGGCDVPPDAKIGVSLLTFPCLVDRGFLPWGGAQLSPLAALLTTPTVIHMRQRMQIVDSLEQRIRIVMRDLYNISRGPPLRSDRVTIWGTDYADATGDDPGYPWIREPQRRIGETPATARIDGQWTPLGATKALRSLARFRECRQACLRNFSSLPIELQMAANRDDFTPETIAAAGGPNNQAPPPPTKAKRQLAWK